MAMSSVANPQSLLDELLSWLDRKAAYADTREIIEIFAEGNDPHDLYASLFDAIGDIQGRWRDEAYDAHNEGFYCLASLRDAERHEELADELDGLKAKVDAALLRHLILTNPQAARRRIEGTQVSARWETLAGQVIAAQLAEAA